MLKAIFTCIAMTCASIAQAATLDFGEAGTGFLGTTQISITGATVTALPPSGDNLFVFSPSDRFCFIMGNVCEGDGEIDFNGTVSGLTFTSEGFNPGDFTVISALASGGGVLGTVNVTTNMLIDFSGLSGISKLMFDDSSTGAGFSFGAFSFEFDGSDVPLPAAAPLMLLGLGFLARRRLTA